MKEYFLGWSLATVISYKTMVLLSCTPALRAVVCRMSSTQKIHHRVLIAGGGSGGIAVASKLKRLMPSFDVAIIEPSDVRFFQLSTNFLN
ncbi:unnamed protein product [Schistocephalus solidus]|uniref:Pyr_redox_2 domain-containing protein n=1 Tax=Schistocephalus solidus TaxID=70667 RepID=A0A183TER2_SCHSO|nr:unnamed protein product [Schistocephalus solidus]